MLRHAANRLLIALQLGAAAMGVIAIAAVSPLAAAAAQKTFATPAAAVDALIAANRGNHIGKLLAILGPEGAKLIHSGDPVADRRGRTRFVAAYDEAHKLELDGDSKAILIVGADQWPLPIPLIREHARWRFDTKAGAEEILNRRIGRNELSVIEVCRAYVAAQREYAAKNLGSGGSAEYAQHFMSTIGQRDGLYWPVKAGEEESPLGPLIARARAAGYRPGTPHLKPRPYYGYYFRILDPTRAERAGRREELCRQRSYDRWLRADRLSGHLRRFRHHDLHRQPGRHRLSEQSRPCHDTHRPSDHAVRSGCELARERAMIAMP